MLDYNGFIDKYQDLVQEYGIMLFATQDGFLDITAKDDDAKFMQAHFDDLRSCI